MIRRRRSPRVRVRALTGGVKLKRSVFTVGKKEQVSILDIGPNGMSFQRDQVAEPGTRCSFVVEFEPWVTVRGQGTVRHCRKAEQGGYILGVEFNRISREGKRFLGNSANLLERTGTNVLELALPLGEKLVQIRRGLGLTIVELSLVSGVPAERISRVESGQELDPPDEVIGRLAGGMGITPACLQPRTAGPVPPPSFERLAHPA